MKRSSVVTLTATVLLCLVTTLPERSLGYLPGQSPSGNWSGYGVFSTQTEGQITGISGSWTVPTGTFYPYTSNNNQGQGLGIWIGIGGMNEDALIQVGTNEIVNLPFAQQLCGSSPCYYLFAQVFGQQGILYDVYPTSASCAGAGGKMVDCTVKPGDSISAYITVGTNYVNHPTPGFEFFVSNATEGWSWNSSMGSNAPTNGVIFTASNLSSAEWIVEAPNLPTLPLLNFAPVSFGGAASFQGTAQYLLHLGENGMVMNDPNGGCAVPTDVSNNTYKLGGETGGTFTVQFVPPSQGSLGCPSQYVQSPLISAVLPESRSAQPGGTVTAFATVINTGTATLTGCSIAPFPIVPANFVYQTTDPTTNALTGTANTPVSIPGSNGSQTFVIAFTPNAAIAPADVQFLFSCASVNAAPITIGLNTLLLSASTTTSTPDVVALGATLQNDGIVHVTGTPMQGAFAVATDNLGSGDTITVATNTGAETLPISVTVCQTNPTTGACLQTPSATVATTISPNATPTFAVFVSASGTVPFDPANNRIFVTFTDSTNAIRGETSVAVETQ